MKTIKGIITVLAILLGIKNMQADNRCFSLQSNDTTYTVKLEINGSQVKANYDIIWTNGEQKSIKTGAIVSGNIQFANKQFVNGAFVKTTITWILNGNSIQLNDGKILAEGSCP